MSKYAERWGERAAGSVAASDLVAKCFIKGTTYADRGEKADGVSVIGVESDDNISLHVSGDVNVTADGTVTAGDEVTSGENGKAIKKYPDQTIKRKETTESKTEDTTLADDAELKAITLTKEMIYKLEGKIAVTNHDAGAARSIKWKLSVPAGASATGTIVGSPSVGGDQVVVDEMADLTAEKTYEIDQDESGFIGFDGHVNMGTAEVGDLAFQWAANASVTSPLDVQAGSIVNVEAETPQSLNGVAKSTNTDGDVLVRLNG